MRRLLLLLLPWTLLLPELARGQDAGTPAPRRPPTRKQLTTPDPKVTQELEKLPRDIPRKFTWDIPQVLEKVEVPGVVEGMGTPVKLHAVRTKLKLLDIMGYMDREFAKARLYVAPRKDLTMLTSDPQLHGFDPFRKIGFSVIYQPNADGTTTLILGEAHLDEGRGLSSGFSLPVHPRAQGTLQSKQEGAVVVAYTVQAPEAEVAQFYTDVLGMQGYTPISRLKFRKDRQQVVVAYQPNKGTGAAAVVVTQSAYLAEGPVDPNAAPASVH